MTINREHFEAWLFRQPKERQLDYINGLASDNPPCLFCAYGMETFDSFLGCSSVHFYVSKVDNYSYGDLADFESFLPRGTFTIADAQRVYLSLFPDPQAVSCGDGNEILPSKKQTESQKSHSVVAS